MMMAWCRSSCLPRSSPCCDPMGGEGEGGERLIYHLNMIIYHISRISLICDYIKVSKCLTDVCEYLNHPEAFVRLFLIHFFKSYRSEDTMCALFAKPAHTIFVLSQVLSWRFHSIWVEVCRPTGSFFFNFLL